VDAPGATGDFIDVDHDSLQKDAIFGDAEALRGVGDKALDNRFNFPAQDAFVRAREAGVTQKGGAAGEDLLIGRLHVGVCADDRADLAVQHSGQGDFFRSGFGVHVDNDDARLLVQARYLRLGGGKGIVEVGHKDAALDVDHRNRAASRDLEHSGATADGARWIIERPQETRFLVQQFHDFLLVPQMIAGSHDVDAGGKDLFGGPGSDAGAAGGVLAIGNDRVEVEASAQLWDQLLNRFAARLAHDIADKKNVHRGQVSECGCSLPLPSCGSLRMLWGMKPLALLLAVFVSANAMAHVAVDEMASAAGAFVASLKPEQAEKGTFKLKDDERENWHFIPKARKGLPIKEMTPEQRQLATKLLRSGLSDAGHRKATTIMNLETILKELEGPNSRMVRDPELYYVSVFGKPDPKGTWGWRVEGHHMSVNFTIVKGEYVAGTPSFFGSNPAEVKEGPRKGLRALADEEDMGRQVVKALSAEQRDQAIFDKTAPKDIFTMAERHVKPLEQKGIAAAKLNKTQKDLLMQLINAYLNNNRPDLAKEDLRKIQEAGVDKIHFAWAGGIEKGEPHYYRVQGPTFLLEYDNTQNNANHIHAVWRDFANDFGEDLLKKHYQETPHP
jgi:hypothetical protein